MAGVRCHQAQVPICTVPRRSHALCVSTDILSAPLTLVAGLGEFMAAKEAKTLIAMILPTFDLNLDKSRSVEEFFGVVMPSYEGVYMYVAELKS